MPFKLYVDKNEDFECEVSVKNASLKNSIARLVVESHDGLNLIFKGRIEDGKCIIPIKRLKGLLDENSRGNMHLEMVVEDTYFKPWEEDFIVEEHTSVKVKVSEQKSSPSNKPILEVKIANPIIKPPVKQQNSFAAPSTEIAAICKRFGIGKNNVMTRKADFAQILKEYFKSNPEYNKHAGAILIEIRNFLK